MRESEKHESKAIASTAAAGIPMKRSPLFPRIPALSSRPYTVSFLGNPSPAPPPPCPPASVPYDSQLESLRQAKG